MRIVQIIDSLEVGGAERMAVNYANALSIEISFSGLVTTRKEGGLKNKIYSDVNYLFLNKIGTFDLAAVFRLRTYCKNNNVEYIQPHSSSYFVAFLVKLIYPKIQIIWHDHNGLSEFLDSQNWMPLKIISFFFSGIIVVNDQLKNWAIKELNCNKVIYLPNFTSIENTSISETVLKGNSGKKIICIANLRAQKNHFLLIRVAKRLVISHPEWSFHLVGKNFNDDYSKELVSQIDINNLQDNVYIYGTKDDTLNIIRQAEIAILTSESEGLPVALLEYGIQKKPVVVTNVGEIPRIILDGVNGLIVPTDDDEFFYNSLIRLLENPKLRDELGGKFYETVVKNNSEQEVIKSYLNWIKKT